MHFIIINYVPYAGSDKNTLAVMQVVISLSRAVIKFFRNNTRADQYTVCGYDDDRLQTVTTFINLVKRKEKNSSIFFF